MDEEQKARIVDMTSAVLGVFKDYDADEEEAIQSLALIAGAVLNLVEGDDVAIPFQRLMSMIGDHISTAHGLNLRNDARQP